MLLDKLPSEESRRWYAAQAIEHNWSRNVLVMQIETRLRERSGTAVTNFEIRSTPQQCYPIQTAIFSCGNRPPDLPAGQSACSGRLMVKMVPLPSARLWASTLPPWARAIRRTT